MKQTKTTHKTPRLRKFLLTVFLPVLCIALIGLAIYGFFVGEGSTGFSARPAAVLHSPDDAGYIPRAAEPLNLTVSAPQCFLYNCDTGEYLYIKGEDKVVYPASITKLATALCALEYLSPEELITPGDELSLVREGSSVAYIKTSHTLTAEMLIEGMLLPSGNDAAFALAAAAGYRTDGEAPADGAAAVERFMSALNEKLALRQMVGTHFTVPDGYEDEGLAYSTLEDMTLLALLAKENALIARYAALPEDHVTYASGHTNDWQNRNLLLQPDSEYYRPEVTGLKTGSLDENYNILLTAEDGTRSYIIGLFSERSKKELYTDACRILDLLFSGDAS